MALKNPFSRSEKNPAPERKARFMTDADVAVEQERISIANERRNQIGADLTRRREEIANKEAQDAAGIRERMKKM